MLLLLFFPSIVVVLSRMSGKKSPENKNAGASSHSLNSGTTRTAAAGGATSPSVSNHGVVKDSSPSTTPQNARAQRTPSPSTRNERRSPSPSKVLPSGNNRAVNNSQGSRSPSPVPAKGRTQAAKRELKKQNVKFVFDSPLLKQENGGFIKKRKARKVSRPVRNRATPPLSQKNSDKEEGGVSGESEKELSPAVNAGKSSPTRGSHQEEGNSSGSMSPSSAAKQPKEMGGINLADCQVGNQIKRVPNEKALEEELAPSLFSPSSFVEVSKGQPGGGNAEDHRDEPELGGGLLFPPDSPTSYGTGAGDTEVKAPSHSPPGPNSLSPKSVQEGGGARGRGRARARRGGRSSSPSRSLSPKPKVRKSSSPSRGKSPTSSSRVTQSPSPPTAVSPKASNPSYVRSASATASSSSSPDMSSSPPSHPHHPPAPSAGARHSDSDAAITATAFSEPEKAVTPDHPESGNAEKERSSSLPSIASKASSGGSSPPSHAKGGQPTKQGHNNSSSSIGVHGSEAVGDASEKEKEGEVPPHPTPTAPTSGNNASSSSSVNPTPTSSSIPQPPLVRPQDSVSHPLAPSLEVPRVPPIRKSKKEIVKNGEKKTLPPISNSASSKKGTRPPKGSGVGGAFNADASISTSHLQVIPTIHRAKDVTPRNSISNTSLSFVPSLTSSISSDTHSARSDEGSHALTHGHDGSHAVTHPLKASTAPPSVLGKKKFARVKNHPNNNNNGNGNSSTKLMGSKSALHRGSPRKNSVDGASTENDKVNDDDDGGRGGGKGLPLNHHGEPSNTAAHSPSSSSPLSGGPINLTSVKWANSPLNPGGPRFAPSSSLLEEGKVSSPSKQQGPLHPSPSPNSANRGVGHGKRHLVNPTEGEPGSVPAPPTLLPKIHGGRAGPKRSGSPTGLASSRDIGGNGGTPQSKFNNSHTRHSMTNPMESLSTGNRRLSNENNHHKLASNSNLFLKQARGGGLPDRPASDSKNSSVDADRTKQHMMEKPVAKGSLVGQGGTDARSGEGGSPNVSGTYPAHGNSSGSTAPPQDFPSTSLNHTSEAIQSVPDLNISQDELYQEFMEFMRWKKAHSANSLSSDLKEAASFTFPASSTPRVASRKNSILTSSGEEMGRAFIWGRKNSSSIRSSLDTNESAKGNNITEKAPPPLPPIPAGAAAAQKGEPPSPEKSNSNHSSTSNVSGSTSKSRSASFNSKDDLGDRSTSIGSSFGTDFTQMQRQGIYPVVPVSAPEDEAAMSAIPRHLLFRRDSTFSDDSSRSSNSKSSSGSSSSSSFCLPNIAGATIPPGKKLEIPKSAPLPVVNTLKFGENDGIIEGVMFSPAVRSTPS